MRVDGPISVPENLQPDKVGRSGSTTQQSRVSSADTGQDQAQLSADSQTIQQLKTTLSQVSEIRQGRVQALRQAMSSGSYQVSDQQLSDAMASDMITGIVA
jgi:flagellar biosynthesis anti-sigma factor FlgM